MEELDAIDALIEEPWWYETSYETFQPASQILELDSFFMDIPYVCEKQSGIVPEAAVSAAATDSTNQNVRFLDQMPAYSYDVDTTHDPTRQLQDSNDADLGDFFSRPIKIADFQWGTGTALQTDLDPWNLYFSNPRVINRISNFKLMRANLNVKVIINGNGFQYGRVLCNYLPLEAFDNLTAKTALISADLVQLSQMPHIYLDPCTSTGGELKLPFFWHENYIDVVDGTWSQLGQLFFRSINDLKHANGATDVVTISVFAWASDVSVSVLTSRNPLFITPQIGEEVDEANATGVVSGPASAVAKVTNALGMIPTIGPFALATSQIATGIASMARMLGYCRPPVTKNPEPYRPLPISHLATTTVPDTALKLTVDDKQELTIDPRIAGLGADDLMGIKSIAKRESYLTQFDWQVTTPTESLLWNSRVSPVIWTESGISPNEAYHFPPCAMAALPFKYWTGSMTFRFQIVCSTFHKGRLRFVYDPDYLTSDVGGASPEYNVNYQEIVDIADRTDFSITVGNGQTRSLLDHHLPGEDTQADMYGTSLITTDGPGNGVIGVYIVNELTVPNSGVNNDIQINVFVSMSDDFEVFVPDDWFAKFVAKPYTPPVFRAGQRVLMEPQSGAEVPESQNTAEPSAPLQTQSDPLGPGWQDNALLNKVFTGESIMSFRQMLKRYTLHERISIGIGATDENRRITLTRNMFPYLRGNVSGAVHTTVDGEAYSYCNTLLLHWVTLAFQGWRGSIRRKVLFFNEGIASISGGTYVQREPEFSKYSTYSQSILTAATPATTDQGAYEVVRNDDILLGSVESNVIGAKGMAYANTRVNPNLEFESPYYSTYRFYPGKNQNYTDGNIRSEGFSLIGNVAADANSEFDIHVATGEDFQTYFWTGLPRMYYENAPPLPATT